ncbi:MAG: ATPase, T2SS/T4P/T4SS family [Candidatus Altiarchaeota archaeon]
MSRIIPDLSVIKNGLLTDYVSRFGGDLTVIIPEPVFTELERQARQGMETGLDGLKELENLQKLVQDVNKEVEFRESRAGESRDPGMLDSILRGIAESEKAMLLTSDPINYLACRGMGVNVSYIDSKTTDSKPRLFELFDEKTMSIHMKEGIPVFAKRGEVGSFELVVVSSEISRRQADVYARELVEYAIAHPEGFIEQQDPGATVLQVQDYRIVITRPPFSDGIEITAVKPIRKTRLEDYHLSEKLVERLDSHAEGILVSGSPGMGKSTFAQALAEHYQSKGMIVKTMEHPRDLQVNQYITQYGPLNGSMESTSDILLLVRPDYTIFDEVRKTSDFKVLADMRLAGVGLIGVTHSSKAIDAVQRLVGRVELGMIPHIVDTVIHIDKGWVGKVYALLMTVKVPYGMTESDLSRPVLQVSDFETGSPEYELYSFGEEVVVVPVGKPLSFRQSRDGVAVSRTKKFIIIRSQAHANRYVEVHVGDRMVYSGRVNRSGVMRVPRASNHGRLISDALSRGGEISLK